MALYTKDSIERLKDSVDMVELVGARTDLRRVGARYVGLCPFHDERTPSFSVSAEHKLYHCFGCGESGDAIGFVLATEGIEFREAVELLADRHGVKLEREQEDPGAERRRRRRERLLGLVERAAAFYARYLWESAEAAKARDYLAGRGLGAGVLREFRVGYAPSAWDRIVTAAQRDGFKPEEIAAAGLAQRGRQGGLYDRFRERIAFPLADARGRVLGFGARALRDNQPPKYLNTSENELYHKRRQLFGIERARAAAVRAGRMVVVEGYTDVLALHQAGIPESVAIMGTAVTQEQLAELSRAAPGTPILLALDADRAGQEAMLRAARGARDRGGELRVVALPAGEDPADLLAGGDAGGGGDADAAGDADARLEAFEGLLAASLSVPEFEVRRVLADSDLSAGGGRDRALERVAPIIASMSPSSAARDELARFAADRLDVPVEYLMTRVSTPAPPTGAERHPPAGVPAGQGRNGGESPGEPELDAVARAERTFLAMCLAEPGPGRELLAGLADDHLSSAALGRVRGWLAAHFDSPLEGLPADDPALAALVTDVVMRAEEEPTSEHVLRVSYLQLEKRRVERELRRAERSGDLQLQRELPITKEQLTREIADVMGKA